MSLQGFGVTRRPARTRLPPADRRAQLLSHAIACCAEHGLARATQAQVAARAGVSVSAVYSYFRTRADLVDAVLKAVETAIITMVEGVAATPGPAPMVLTELARQTAAMAVHAPDLVRVWLDWSAGVRAETWPQFLLLQHRLRRLVATILLRSPGAALDLEGARVASATRLFVGGAHTLALLRFENISAAELDMFIDQMVGGTLAALAPAD